jgi:hypothetical protein
MTDNPFNCPSHIQHAMKQRPDLPLFEAVIAIGADRVQWNEEKVPAGTNVSEDWASTRWLLDGKPASFGALRYLAKQLSDALEGESQDT